MIQPNPLQACSALARSPDEENKRNRSGMVLCAFPYPFTPLPRNRTRHKFIPQWSEASHSSLSLYGVRFLLITGTRNYFSTSPTPTQKPRLDMALDIHTSRGRTVAQQTMQTFLRSSLLLTIRWRWSSLLRLDLWSWRENRAAQIKLHQDQHQTWLDNTPQYDSESILDNNRKEPYTHFHSIPLSKYSANPFVSSTFCNRRYSRQNLILSKIYRILRP